MTVIRLSEHQLYYNGLFINFDNEEYLFFKNYLLKKTAITQVA